MKINLNRISTNFEQNTCHGVMSLDGQEIAKTLELPFKQNEHSISSIPTGIYTCRRIESPKFG
ncbi:MAG: hypothetical protein HQK93_07210 [Nitrospirae bacterium]|nr:hypothetical protein [Nitrospirota bacterium]